MAPRGGRDDRQRWNSRDTEARHGARSRGSRRPRVVDVEVRQSHGLHAACGVSVQLAIEQATRPVALTLARAAVRALAARWTRARSRHRAISVYALRNHAARSVRTGRVAILLRAGPGMEVC